MRLLRFSPVMLLGWLVIVPAWAASDKPVEITLPVETARLAESPLPGYALAIGLCSTCHSAEYVQYQPNANRAYWRAATVKMQKVFGAPIPDAAIEPIADYLVKTYGMERPATGSSGKTVPAPGAVGR